MGLAAFEKDLCQLLRARFPLLYIETWEEQRALDVITRLAGDATLVRTPRSVEVWSATTGLVPIGSPAGRDDRTVNLTAALEQAARVTGPSVLIFRDIHRHLGSDGNADEIVVRSLRDLVPVYRDSPFPVTLIMVSPVLHLPNELERSVTILDLPLPDEDELKKLLDEMIAANSPTGRISFPLADEDFRRLVRSAVGLTLDEAENAFARAMVNDNALSPLDVDAVLQEKRQTVRRSGVLDCVSVPGTMDNVAGLDNLKRWLGLRAGAWLGAGSEYGLPTPKGVLITGVPGCGKSLIAKAIAGEWGLPLLRLDIGRLFAGIVGSSEQNMREALRTAEAMAPCVLWIDEIEKGFSGLRSEGDSGVSRRIFGTFLTWMQEKDQPVFVVATANNVDALPPEFLRKGRFDETFFVDLPNPTERKAIWNLHLLGHLEAAPAARGALVVESALLTRLSEASEGYTGAEIEQAVTAALYEAFAQEQPLKELNVMRTLQAMVPLARTQREAIAALRAWAADRTVPATAISPTSTKGRATTY